MANIAVDGNPSCVLDAVTLPPAAAVVPVATRARPVATGIQVYTRVGEGRLAQTRVKSDDVEAMAVAASIFSAGKDEFVWSSDDDDEDDESVAPDSDHEVHSPAAAAILAAGGPDVSFLGNDVS